MIVSNLGAVPLPVQLPIGDEDRFEGVIDLITMEEIVWTGEELGAKFERRPIRDALKKEAEEWHNKLVELAVEQEEETMMAYLEGTAPSPETLRSCIRKGTCNLAFVPVLCGTAFKNKGVQPLLDAVVSFLPSPADKPKMEGTKPSDETVKMVRGADDKEPFSGLAFKARLSSLVLSLFSRERGALVSRPRRPRCPAL